MLQTFGQSLFLFQHYSVTVHKARCIVHSSVWKNLNGLDRVPTTTPSNNFGMNSNADYVPNSCGKPSQNSGGCYSSRAFPMVLEWHIFTYYIRVFCPINSAVKALTQSHPTHKSRELKAAQTRTEPKMNQRTALNRAQERLEEGSTSGTHTIQPSGWDDGDTFKQKREETELHLRCEGGRCWDLLKRHWKTGSQHQLTQLMFSCQTTNTNRQLGLWLAWIQIEDETRRGSTHQGNMLERLRSRGKRERVMKLAS